jgi:hypothetical protein
VRPPRTALWLVDQFAAPDQREALIGDLQEEFTAVLATRGITPARRWFWRQTTRTLVHLIAASIRKSPARLLLSMLAGLLLWWNVPSVVEEGVRRMHHRWNVYDYIDAYSFWLLYAVLVENVIAPVLVGSLLALANKGRESVPSAGLAVVILVLAVVAIPRNVFSQQNLVAQNPGLRGVWPVFWHFQIQNTLLASFTALSLLIGGLIVRRARFAAVSPITGNA